MCTLAVYLRCFEAFPLVIAANRDEFLDRVSLPPELIPSEPPVFCGRDGVHGGTWLGVNAEGVAAALLNRRSNDSPDPTRRSRGLLCLDGLAHRSAASAAEALAGLRPSDYNPFNLLLADSREAWVVSNPRGQLARRALAPGLHLLTNLDVNDPECPRIAASTQRFADVLSEVSQGPTVEDLVRRLHPILASHDLVLDPRDRGPGNALCVHWESLGYGTRSSTLLFLDRHGRWTYRHCPSAPCRGEYRPEPADEGFDLQRRRA